MTGLVRKPLQQLLQLDGDEVVTLVGVVHDHLVWRDRNVARNRGGRRVACHRKCSVKTYAQREQLVAVGAAVGRGRMSHSSLGRTL